MPLNLSYGTIRPQFVGTPIEDIKATTEALGLEYKTQKQTADNLEITLANLELINVDNPKKYKAIENLKTTLKGVIERGDWENAANVVGEATKQFATDKELKGSLQSKALRDANVAKEEEYVKNGTKNASDVAKGIEMADAAYSQTGGVSLDANGNIINLYSPEAVPEYVSYIELADKLGKDFASDESPISWSSKGQIVRGYIKDGKLMKDVGNGYLAVGDIKSIDKEELQSFYSSVFANDQKVQQYAAFKNKVKDFDTYGTTNLAKFDISKQIGTDFTGQPVTIAHNMELEYKELLVKNDPINFTVIGGDLYRVERDPATGVPIKETVNGVEQNKLTLVEGGAYGQMANTIINNSNLKTNFINDLHGLRTNAELASVNAAFSEKYGYEAINLKYMQDNVYLETLKANLQDRNNAKEFKRHNPDKGNVFSQTVNAGNPTIRPNSEIFDELDRLQNNNDVPSKIRRAELLQELNQNNRIESYAKTVQINKYSPDLIQNIKNGIVSGDEQITGLVNTIFGESADYVKSLVKNGTATSMVDGYIAAYAFNHSNELASSGIISEEERDNINDDKYFSNTTTYQRTGETIIGALAPVGFMTTKLLGRRVALNDWVQDNGFTNTATDTEVKFFNAKTQEYYNNSLLTLVNQSGSVTFNGKTYKNLSDAGTALLGETVRYDNNTGEFVNKEGKRIKASFGTYGTDAGDEGVTITLNNQTMRANNPQAGLLSARAIATSWGVENADQLTEDEIYFQSGVITGVYKNGKLVPNSQLSNEVIQERYYGGGKSRTETIISTRATQQQKLDFSKTSSNPNSSSFVVNNQGKKATVGTKVYNNKPTEYYVTYTDKDNSTVTLMTNSLDAAFGVALTQTK